MVSPVRTMSAHCRRAVSVLLLVSAGVGACDRATPVTLRNDSPDSLTQVMAVVTGDSSGVARLDPGATVTIDLHPEGESHIEVRSLRGGRTERMVVDTYLEPGYTDTLFVSIERTRATVLARD